jgi:hypothetical protein
MDRASQAGQRAVETLGIYALARGVAASRRLYGSRAADVRLRVPPVELPPEVWQRVAEQIIALRPGWRAVDLVDARGRVVAAAVQEGAR